MAKEISERDWKLFREKLPVWQETYIEKLNKKYIEILESSDSSAEKFWRLEKCIKNDKQKTGVVCEMSRSKMVVNIISLITEGVIDIDDLSEFGDDLKSTVKIVLDL